LAGKKKIVKLNSANIKPHGISQLATQVLSTEVVLKERDTCILHRCGEFLLLPLSLWIKNRATNESMGLAGESKPQPLATCSKVVSP